jgi:mRNA interferase HicA
VTWSELIRLLKRHGFEELRSGRGSHRQFWNPKTKRIVTIAVHTKKDIGPGLLHRILKDAGIT